MEMKITSTNKTLLLDGVPVRAWKGVTPQGNACVVFVHRIGIAEENFSDLSELREVNAPTEWQPLEAVMRDLG